MKKTCAILSAVLVAVAAASLAFATPVELKLDKKTVEINTFYDGTTVQAGGTIPRGAEAVVRLSGKPQELHLKKKGKAGGLLWMNIADLTFENVPKIYMLYTAETGKKYLADPSLGFSLPSLQDRIEISPAGEDKKFYFNEFLKLKKHESVYAEFPREINYLDDGGGRERRFRVALQIPPRMSEDEYTIDLFAVQDGRVIGRDSRKLEVKMVSFPQMLSELAFKKSLLYGILSVLIAVGAGFLTGTLFRSRGGAH